MNKKLLSIAVAMCLFGMNAMAQNARQISANMKKQVVPGFQADYKVSKKLMELTLEDEFKKADLGKGKSSSGFRKYEAVVLPAISPNKLDLYCKTSGGKNDATVLMLVSTGYDNYVDASKDPSIAANTIAYLNKLTEDAVAMQATLDLAAQQKELEKAKEKLEKSEREKAKLAKKKADLDKKLSAEKSTQEKAAEKVELEKNKLDNMKQGIE